MKLLILLLLLFGLSFPLSAKPLQDCRSYEPATLALTGNIFRKTFAGRPNYESITKGDEPETYWILRLASPICVKENTNADEPAENNINALQLVFFGTGEYARYRKLLGRLVTVDGTLFHANTGHHHTMVLIIVNRIQAVQKTSNRIRRKYLLKSKNRFTGQGSNLSSLLMPINLRIV